MILNRLVLSRLVLMVAYIGFAAWTAVIATLIQYSSLLLYSLTASLVLFVGAVALRRGDLLLASWVWLGANFVVGQATLVSGMSYPQIAFLVVIVFVAGELSNFLEFLYPMRTGATQMDNQDYDRRISILKRHLRSVSLFAASGGALGMVGVALISPLALVSNPLLAVGAVLSFVVVLVAALSLEWRSGKQVRV
jgi:hypothetical protein